jgi:hypothetical protein
MNKYFLFFILVVSVSRHSFAQPSVPVDLVTGRAQISIPLTVISEGAVRIPISLNYNSTGVKVTDGDATGVGWHLSAGGGVYRQVRGLPDDYAGNPSDLDDARRGWLFGTGSNRVGHVIHNFAQSSDASFGTHTDEVIDYNYFEALACVKDTEPDLFTFTAPGLAGSFVFGPDGLAKPVPYQDIKIDYQTATIEAITTITGIQITKNDGTRYTFYPTIKVKQDGSIFKTNIFTTLFHVQSRFYSKLITFFSAWELTSITSPGGGSIELSYTQERHSDSREYFTVSSNSHPEPDTTWFLDQQISSRKVAAINSLSQKMEFLWSGGEELMIATLTDKTTGKEKKFNFAWKDIIGSDLPNLPTSRRFLMSLYESRGCDAFPSYTFDYYGITGNTIPILFNKPHVKTDIWGYFNDTATDNSPTIYYYAANSGSDRYRFYPSGQTPTSHISNGSTQRHVNPLTVMYGSLKTINYPTGGKAEITYEPNAYHDVLANTTNYGPGIRVKTVTTSDLVGTAPNTVIDYEYKMSDAVTSSGKWIYRSAFALHDVGTLYSTGARDHSPEPQVMYERVTMVQNGKGRVVTEFKLPGMDPATTGSTGYSDWFAAQTYVARPSNADPGQLSMGYYQMPFAPNINYDFERGLVSKVSSYSEGGQLIHEKIFQYQRLGTTSVVVKGLRYELLRNSPDVRTLGTSPMYVFSHYPILTNAGKVVLTETERVADVNSLSNWLEKSTTYTFSNAHYMLQTLAVTNSDDIEHRTKFRYARDFESLTQPITGDTTAEVIKKLNSNFMHGSQVATISSVFNGSTETNTGAAVTMYGLFADSLGNERVLPKASMVTAGMGGWLEPTVSTSGSNHVFSAPGNYYTASKIDVYDDVGTPVTVRSHDKILNGVLMGHRKSLPIANIRNADARQVVFDDFETWTGFGFVIPQQSPPNQFTYPGGWSGKKGLAMPAGGSIQRTGIRKGRGKHYRYTMRVSGSSNTTIVIRIFNGASQATSATISHNVGSNDWKYYEGRVDMTSANSTFTLKLENNVAVTIDDVAFYPESATVTSTTYEPLFGVTSQTDARGANVFYEYDHMGRIKDLRDQDKTIRQHTDYYYKTLPYPQLQTDFTPATNRLAAVGGQLSFTAPSYECISNVTYDWYVDNVKYADNVTTFQYTFATAKIYIVKMVAEHIAYGTASRQVEITAIPVGNGPLSAHVSTSSLTYYNCDANHSRTFTASLTGCFLPDNIEIKWYYRIASTWIELSPPQTLIGINVLATISSDLKTMTFDPVVAFNGVNNLADYEIKFQVVAGCPLDMGDDFRMERIDTETKSIDFIYNAHCL